MTETYLQKLQREHKERKRRIFGPETRQFVNVESRQKISLAAPKILAPPQDVHVLHPPPFAVTVSFKRPSPLRLLDKILMEVAVKYGVDCPTLKARDRSHINSPARSEFCYRAIMETSLSYADIGRYLDYRDHTSILAAGRKHQRWYPQLPTISRAPPRRRGRPWGRGEKSMQSSQGGEKDYNVDAEADQNQTAVESNQPNPAGEGASVPGNMGDEDLPTDRGDPEQPVPQDEVVQPSGPGNMGDE